MRAIVLVCLAACGGNSTQPACNKKIVTGGCPDALVRWDAGPPCNPARQTGCAAGQKCTWVTDATTPMPLGHMDCVMDGTIAIGDACMSGPVGSTTGFDNCLARQLNSGGYCWNGRCETICDTSDPAGCSAPQACTVHAGILMTTNAQYGTCE